MLLIYNKFKTYTLNLTTLEKTFLNNDKHEIPSSFSKYNSHLNKLIYTINNQNISMFDITTNILNTTPIGEIIYSFDTTNDKLAIHIKNKIAIHKIENNYLKLINGNIFNDENVGKINQIFFNPFDDKILVYECDALTLIKFDTNYNIIFKINFLNESSNTRIKTGARYSLIWIDNNICFSSKYFVFIYNKNGELIFEIEKENVIENIFNIKDNLCILTKDQTIHIYKIDEKTLICKFNLKEYIDDLVSIRNIRFSDELFFIYISNENETKFISFQMNEIFQIDKDSLKLLVIEKETRSYKMEYISYGFELW